LLCCLHYEEDYYLKKSEDFPELGEVIHYKEKKMYVEKNDYYNNRINLIADDRERYILTLEEFKNIRKQNNGKTSS
jgi:cell fate regulator YaaT (PSP1 superfamily)